MLLELTVRNLALIKEAHVAFSEGLNVLTGETGAGKSILLDALALAMGGRASSDLVRHGAPKAEVEALFEVPADHPAARRLAEMGIPADGGHILLRRDVSASGRSVCRINGHLVTLAMLREVGSALVTLCGQHDQQDLLSPDRHLAWIDAYGGEELERCRAEYEALYARYMRVRAELARMTEDEKALAQRLDLLRFQLSEIEEAALEPGEEERLLAERQKLLHAEKLRTALRGAYAALAGDNRGMDWIGHALAYLEQAAAVDPELERVHEAVQSAYYQLEDAARELRDAQEAVPDDDGRLADVEARLALIAKLKRKYGDTVEAILEYAAKVEEELEAIENREARVEQLARELEEIGRDLGVEAEELSHRRKEAAAKLCAAVEAHLRDLNLEHAKLFAELDTLPDEEGIDVGGRRVRAMPHGVDVVSFTWAPNPGEPPKPLARIASGGELSRLMLALKAVVADAEPYGTLVFDEVDAGVSGRAAQRVAEKLAALAAARQVLCVTHLPQVACMADVHFVVSKTVENGETVTRVEPLSEAGRVEELARMLSGVAVTESSKQHAQEMLRLARGSKTAIG